MYLGAHSVSFSQFTIAVTAMPMPMHMHMLMLMLMLMLVLVFRVVKMPLVFFSFVFRFGTASRADVRSNEFIREIGPDFLFLLGDESDLDAADTPDLRAHSFSNGVLGFAHLLHRPATRYSKLNVHQIVLSCFDTLDVPHLDLTGPVETWDPACCALGYGFAACSSD